MKCQLTRAEVNHLRRLVAWVRCDVGQSPDEMVAMMKKLGPKLGDIGDYGKQAMVESYEKSARVPKYIRAAVKSLDKVLHEHGGDIVDGQVIHDKRLPEQKLLAKPRARKGNNGQ